MVASCVGDDTPTLADRDQVRSDDAVEGCCDIGVAVVDRRDLGVDLGLLQNGLRVVAGRGRGLERRLRDGLLLHQIGLALEIGFGLLHRGLRTGLRRLRLLQLQLVGVGLDREQGGSFLYEGTVLVIDRLQKTLHAGDEIDVLDRRGIAGRLQVTRDGSLRRLRDFDLWWWRRHKTILFASS
jgi:hypothetical protein